MRKTKIVATVGPASGTAAGLRQLEAAGVAVFRLNCSHLSTEGLRQQIAMVREACPSAAVLVDVQGPKMRYGGEEVELRAGSRRSFPFDVLGLATVAAAGGLAGLAVGHRVLLDDGRIEAHVAGVGVDGVEVDIARGGVLRRNKGVNLPDTEVTGGVLSEKDRADIAVAREMRAEIVAVSFVQSPDDVVAVRALLGDGVMVVAKIERPQALVHLEDICAQSDGVMAARGDLGVEIPYELIPAIQHEIARTAIRRGIVSICATEMLESMISSSRPTRAEVADVSTAVLDGFDAVMLSAETAVGHDPAGAVTAMARICESAEGQVHMANIFADANPAAAAVTAAASALAKRIDADWILALTYTGFSAHLLAACRPSTTVIAATPDQSIARSLRIFRGVQPLVVARPADVGDAIAAGIRAAREANFVESGDRVVVCASRLSPRSDVDTILLHVEG